MKGDRAEPTLLQLYGEEVAHYNGRGKIELKNSQTMECDYQVGQFENGSIVVLVQWKLSEAPQNYVELLLEDDWIPQRLVGTTAAGQELIATSLHHINSLNPPNGKSPEAMVSLPYTVQELVVGNYRSNDAATARFGLVNFLFRGTSLVERNGGLKRVLNLQLQKTDGTSRQVMVEHCAQYRNTESYLQALHGIRLTSDAILDCADSPLEDLDQVVDDLCMLLSLARGTVVQWIYRSCYDSQGKLLGTRHVAKRTRNYGSLAAINDRDWNGNYTKDFVEGTYQTYLERKETYDLHRGLIYAYLDAKADHDFLEMRGVKLSVAIEMLKAQYLEVANRDGSIFDRGVFAAMRADFKDEIKTILEKSGANNDQRAAVYAKLGELNRQPFVTVLREFCQAVDLNIDDSKLKLFVQCRNSLVHNGRFYCQVAPPDSKVKPLSSPVEEYYFLLNVLDRMYLRMLGYDGPYIDRSDPVGVGTYRNSVN